MQQTTVGPDWAQSIMRDAREANLARTWSTRTQKDGSVAFGCSRSGFVVKVKPSLAAMETCFTVSVMPNNTRAKLTTDTELERVRPESVVRFIAAQLAPPWVDSVVIAESGPSGSYTAQVEPGVTTRIELPFADRSEVDDLRATVGALRMALWDVADEDAAVLSHRIEGRESLEDTIALAERVCRTLRSLRVAR